MPTLRGGGVVFLCFFVATAALAGSAVALTSPPVYTAYVVEGRGLVSNAKVSSNESCIVILKINFSNKYNITNIKIYGDGLNLSSLTRVKALDGHGVTICLLRNSITSNLNIIKIILNKNITIVLESKNSEIKSTHTENNTWNTIPSTSIPPKEKLLPEAPATSSANPNITILTRWLGLALIVASVIAAVIEK